MAVHSLLSVGAYKITGDSGIQIDADSGLVTRRQEIVFRGSLAELFAVFEFGTQSEIPDSGQSRIYCGGPQSVRQIDGTSSNPHWQATIEHVGLHSYVHGSATSVWRIAPLWTAREITLPQEYPRETGTYTYYAGLATTSGQTVYIPTGGHAFDPCTIHDHVPGYNVRGIIVSGIPLHPSHPAIIALIATFGTPNTTSMVNYANNEGAGYNWCKGMPAGATNSGSGVGVWFVGDISAERVIEPLNGTQTLKIYQVTIPIRWLQRKAPV